MSKLSRKLFDGVFGKVGMWSSDTMDRTAYKTMGESFPKLLELTKKNEPILASLPHELFTVTTKDGLKIVGHFFTNEEATDKTAICIHGYHSYGFYDFATVGLEYLNRGYNLLLITNRACGESEGEYTGFGPAESEDAQLFIKLIADKFPNGSIIIHGCSMGGSTACLLSDKELPNVKAIVSDCAFASIRDEFAHMIKFLAHLPPWPLLNMLEKEYKKQFGFGFDREKPIDCVRNAKYPMFFVHGADDNYVLAENSKLMYGVCPTAKHLLIVPGQGHAAAQLGGNEGYFDHIFDFLKEVETENADK